jgi:hypothetical protein
MPRRLLSAAVVVLACWFHGTGGAMAQTPPDATRTPTAPANAPPPVNPATMEPMEFYLAHGDPDACGRDCDEWIVAEGKIDIGAPDRLRALLAKLGSRRPPVYLHSPGGSVTASLALGHMFRDKKMQVSVAHTLPVLCSRDKPQDDTCAAQKRAGLPIDATFDPISAMCNSGCVYALVGGVVHVVPPWVKVAIHDVGLDPKSSLPRGTSLAATVQSVHTLIRSYLREMGIDNALFTATMGTPFESIRPLQREEMARFGIDSRTFGETAWQFLNKPTPQIRKLFFGRTDGDAPGYIDGAVTVDCSPGLGTPLRFIRPHITGEDDSPSGGAVARAIIVVNGKALKLYRASSLNYYIRSTQVPSETLSSASDYGTIELPGAEVERKDAVTLAMDGFSAAYGKLRKACVTSAGAALVQTKPTMAGLPARAPDAPPASSKISTTAELARVATTEHKLQLDFFYLVQVDCSSVGRTSVKIIEQPQHGTLSIEDGKASADFPASDQRHACNGRQSDGTFAFYEPNSDYRGADSVTLSITPPLGAARTQHYSIEVK